MKKHIDDTILTVNGLYIIGSVPFLVRSIDRVFMDKKNGLTVAFTAQALTDGFDVFYDIINSANAHQLQHFQDVLDKAYPDR